MLKVTAFRRISGVVFGLGLLVPAVALSAENLCQLEGWPCAAIAASVGPKTVRAIHDPMHRDERILDGGIADITIKGGQMLTMVWKGQADSESKEKARVSVKVISNKAPPPGCTEPKWLDDSFEGTRDVELPACHIGRNFVITYRMEQGKGRETDVKTARIRVHVVDPHVRVAESANQDAGSTQPAQPQLRGDDEADFNKLDEE
jgi:hypothetical protein